MVKLLKDKSKKEVKRTDGGKKNKKDFFISNISTIDFLPFLFLSNVLML